MNYKLILFDLDDTLFAWFAFWEAGMQAAMKEHHSTRHLDTTSLFSVFNHNSLALWADVEQGKLDWQTYRRMRFVETMRHFGKETDEQTADDFMRLFTIKKMDFLKPDPAVIRLLETLKDNYRFGIVTNGPADQQYQKVAALKLSPFFADESIFVSGEVGFSKPDPRIFQAALDHFGVVPSETLFVGDSWHADIVGAIDLGMDAAWVNPEKADPATAHRPIVVIKNIAELGGFLAGGRN